jgi:hypothetical protein
MTTRVSHQPVGVQRREKGAVYSLTFTLSEVLIRVAMCASACVCVLKEHLFSVQILAPFLVFAARFFVSYFVRCTRESVMYTRGYQDALALQKA